MYRGKIRTEKILKVKVKIHNMIYNTKQVKIPVLDSVFEGHKFSLTGEMIKSQTERDYIKRPE